MNHPKIHHVVIGCKLPPYFDVPQFGNVARIISKYPIKYIVCSNSIANALFIDVKAECSRIKPNGGLGGLGGGFIKPTALANVHLFHRELINCGRPDISIVGLGGVCSGADAFELILCGASAVQVGTCHWEEGSKCFGRIKQELLALMKEKGYKTIDDFKGKLKQFERNQGAWKSIVPIHAKSSAARIYSSVSQIFTDFLSFVKSKEFIFFSVITLLALFLCMTPN
jgi:dihydroorotate dehydrogenase (fumarate)